MIRLSPKLYAFLKALETRPRPRPKGTIVGPAARRAGYTEDEVTVKGVKMAASQAKADLGPEWYLSTKFTGREMLTEEGRSALDQHRSAG